MAEITVRNISNFEPDVGKPTPLERGQTAKVKVTPEIEDFLEAGVLIDVTPEKPKADAKSAKPTRGGDA